MEGFRSQLTSLCARNFGMRILAIRDCYVIAIEGAQGSGKTTLVHAIAARLRERHVRASVVAEATRDSSYFEDAVLHGAPADIIMELHIAALLIQRELENARHSRMIVCDRGILNVVAYARMIVQSGDAIASELMDTLSAFCGTYALLYDLTFYAEDRYERAVADPFRHLKDGTAALTDAEDSDVALRAAYSAARIPLLVIPRNLELPKKVAWVEGMVAARLPAALLP